MPRTKRYTYLKYQDDDATEFTAVARCSAGADFAYESWDGEDWDYLSDSFDDIADRPGWYPASEQEVLEALPRLSRRYAELKAEQERQKELDEKRKVQNQRLEFTLRGMGGGWTELEKGAAALHKLYTALFNAGFSREQALQMVTEILAQPHRDAVPPLLPVNQSLN